MGINRNIVECKLVSDRPADVMAFVLIETLWNVNIFPWFLSSKQNIVLIETLWNVNEDTLLYWSTAAGVLIETLWNVNESNGTWHKSPKVGINRNIVECKYR